MSPGLQLLSLPPFSSYPSYHAHAPLTTTVTQAAAVAAARDARAELTTFLETNASSLFARANSGGGGGAKRKGKGKGKGRRKFKGDLGAEMEKRKTWLRLQAKAKYTERKMKEFL